MRTVTRRVIDMTIDEAIRQFKYDAECNRADLDLSYAEDNEQIAEWMEELKSLKENSISKEAFEKMKSKAYKKGHRQGYNKAIDDFVNFAKSLPVVEEEDGTIRPMWLEEMAEQLKECVEE